MPWTDPPESVPSYRSPQVLAYGAGIISGGLMIARSLGFSLFKTEIHEAMFAGGVVGVCTCVYALYRRIKRGQNPADPSPRVTLLRK